MVNQNRSPFFMPIIFQSIFAVPLFPQIYLSKKFPARDCQLLAQCVACYWTNCSLNCMVSTYPRVKRLLIRCFQVLLILSRTHISATSAFLSIPSRISAYGNSTTPFLTNILTNRDFHVGNYLTNASEMPNSVSSQWLHSFFLLSNSEPVF